MASAVNFGTEQYFGFDPRTIPGCSLWLDAADATTLTTNGGGNVTQWTDKSGTGATMTPIGTQSNATLQTNYQNGLTALSFSGLNMYRTPTNTGVYPSDVYILVALKSITRMDVMAIGSTGTDNFNSLTFGEYTASRWHNGSSGFSRTPNTVSPTNETSTSLLLMNWSLSNNNFVLRRNGVQLSSTSSYTYGLSAPHAIQIGFRHTDRTNSDLNLSAYIAEVVVYNRQLELGDRQEVEGYLAWKWALTSSLPNGHPYKPYPPAMRAFQPVDIPGATIWLDAADATTFTLSGTNVTEWRDKSSQAYTLTVPSGKTNPTYSNGVLNITGSNGLWTTTNFAISGNAQVSLFAVQTVTGTNTLGGGVHIGFAAAATPPTYFSVATYFESPSSNTYIYVPSCFGPDNLIIVSNSVRGTRILGCGIYNGARIDGTSNGTLLGGATLTNANFGVQPFQVGMRTANNSPTTEGTLCEAICYNVALTTAQRQQVEGYLAWKWGMQATLPTTHPYYRVLPSTPLFTPTAVLNCDLWLDATDVNGTGTPPTNGASVATWADKSGNGRNLIQNGGSNIPTYSTSLATNGLPGMNFTNASGLISSSFAKSLNVTLLLVGMVRSGIGSWGTFWGHFESGRHDSDIQLRNTAGQTVINWHTNNNNSTTQLSYTLNSMVLYSCTMTNGNAMFMQQTNTTGTTSLTYTEPVTTINTNNAPIWVGRSDTNESINSYIYEIVYYRRVLSLSERQQVEGYLAWKWGLQSNLPSTHPYAKFRP
jgi:hypothetical protein